MKTWFQITAKGEDCAEVFIYDEIGLWGIEAKDFIAELNDVQASSITLRLNTPGGSVFQGNAIFNALKRHPATITVHIDGIAASMGSIIALAGDSVHMAENGLYMIHNPYAGVAGDAEEMRKTADLLDKLKSGMVNTYAGKTGLSEEDINAYMNDETWFTAAEAAEAGFIDEITETLEAAACFEADRFKSYKNAPSEAVLNTAVEEEPEPVEEPEPYNHKTPLYARLTEILQR